MGFMDRIRGKSNNQKAEQTQKSSQPKSDRQAHDEFVQRLRAQNQPKPQQSSSLANRASNKPASSGSSSDPQREREWIRSQSPQR